MHVTTFAAVLVVLTLVGLLIVSFYTLQLVFDLRKTLVGAAKTAPISLKGAKDQPGVATMSPMAAVDDVPVAPQVYAAIAAAIHVAFGQSHRVVSIAAHPVELQELQAWSHAGRLHLHDHRVA